MARNSLILNIIPIKNLPVKSPDFFSYFSNYSVKEGSLVEIELKKKTCFGYVVKTFSPEKQRAYLKEQQLILKPITKIINQNPVIFHYQKILASWLKNYYAISLPHAYSLIFPYPKILSKLHKKTEPKIKNQKNQTIWLKSSMELEKLKNKKILFLVPDELLLPDFYQKLQKINSEINYFSSKLTPKQKKLFFADIIANTKKWYLVSKSGIFFPWFNLDGIVILKEGLFLYKEYYKPPYFDYRTVIKKFAQILNLPIYVLDSLPSFHFFLETKRKLPKTPIDFETISSYSEIEENLANSQKNFFFIPQKLIAHRVICELCFQNLQCTKCQNYLWLTKKQLFCPICLQDYPLPDTCPTCKKNTNFAINQLGARGVFQYFQNTLPNPIFLETKDDYQKIDFSKLKAFSIFASFLILEREIPKIDAFFFFNFDQFFYTRDLFLREKFFRILFYFSLRAKKVFLISEKNLQMLHLFKKGDILHYLLQERKIENLPPYKRLVKLTYSLSDLKELQKRTMLVKDFIKKSSDKIEIIGPIFAYPEKQRKKYFLELLLKLPRKNFNLHKLLIDLPYLEKIDAEADSLD